MRKWTLYASIIVFFIAAIILMNSSSLLSLSFIGTADRWQEHLELIGQLIEEENWEQAFREAKNLEQDFHRVIRYIQFSVELEEFRQLEKDFIKLNTALKAEKFLEAEKHRLLIENSLIHLSN